MYLRAVLDTLPHTTFPAATVPLTFLQVYGACQYDILCEVVGMHGCVSEECV